MGTFSSPVKIDHDRKSTPKTIAVFVCLCVALTAVCGIVFYKMAYPKILFNKQVANAKGTDASSVSQTVEADPKNDSVDIDITERLYVSWINEIYTSTDDYIGKTVRIEGMFTGETVNNKNYYYVYRTGPGCCGNDGKMCGVEFTTDGDYPAENDWIEVIGTLETYEESGNYYLTLSNSKVTVKTERGLEVVGNN